MSLFPRLKDGDNKTLWYDEGEGKTPSYKRWYIMEFFHQSHRMESVIEAVLSKSVGAATPYELSVILAYENWLSERTTQPSNFA